MSPGPVTTMISQTASQCDQQSVKKPNQDCQLFLEELSRPQNTILGHYTSICTPDSQTTDLLA